MKISVKLNLSNVLGKICYMCRFSVGEFHYLSFYFSLVWQSMKQ